MKNQIEKEYCQPWQAALEDRRTNNTTTPQTLDCKLSTRQSDLFVELRGAPQSIPARYTTTPPNNTLIAYATILTSGNQILYMSHKVTEWLKIEVKVNTEVDNKNSKILCVSFDPLLTFNRHASNVKCKIQRHTHGQLRGLYLRNRTKRGKLARSSTSTKPIPENR